MVVYRPRPADRSQTKREARHPVVLMVEDEILIRSAVAEHLRDYGYSVVEAANAEEAIAVFASGEPVDVLFSDVNMPGKMDGLSLARWVDRHHPGVPVLLTSGNRSALAEPIGHFLSKPYRIKQVPNRIRSLLEQVQNQGGSAEE